MALTSSGSVRPSRPSPTTSTVRHSTRQIWTALQPNGPDHLRRWLIWTALRPNGPNHLGLWLTWTARRPNGPNHLGLVNYQSGEIIYDEAMDMFAEMDTDGSGWISAQEVIAGMAKLGMRGGSEEIRKLMQVPLWLTAARPMDNPYCSCKLTPRGDADGRPRRGREDRAERVRPVVRAPAPREQGRCTMTHPENIDCPSACWP